MLLVLAVLLAACPSSGEVYSSAAEMRDVFKLERDLVDILDKYTGKVSTL